ncbi:hypothetical protein BU16DRAFT_560429 [Lophium mytilinum]|uniref:GIY-YIG domain-containing protein n=1 Tax=Lophium mytilinum TaxID=390894 RepID=A0A6A6QXD8_9PEZI|nr:hypothetical protein BU16DRAFT_560429 [Lophium mytilinum]
MDKPMPAFYCCYLLRSTKMPTSLYIGSTPNPVRRLKQHNGTTQGGAFRTHKDTHRPWEMICMVHGFPSNIAALQFEWAWQNTCFTHHIPDEERITKPTRRKLKPIIDPEGILPPVERWKLVRPRYSIIQVLQTIHLLLRVNSFQNWPLHVKFFAPDVFKKWEKAKPKKISLREGIRVELDESKPPTDEDSTDEACPPPATGIHSLDVGYTALKSHLQKSRSILENGTMVACGVCERSLRPSKALVLVCPTEDCRSASHMACLSTKFLAAGNGNALIPTNGKCPDCKATLEWSSLVKELSLRTRAVEEVEAIITGKKSKTNLSEAEEVLAGLVPIAIHEEKDLGSDEDESDDGWILQEVGGVDEEFELGFPTGDDAILTTRPV